MKKKISSSIKQWKLLALLLLLGACKKQEIPEKETSPFLNTFSMRVGGQLWEPSQIQGDNCQRTFKASWSQLTQNSLRKPYYTIRAYKDPNAVATNQSQNGLTIQIFDVPQTGTYSLTGSYAEPHQSYVVFSVWNPLGTNTLYVNKKGVSSFAVEVTELLPPLVGNTIPGIKGTFSGTLYNHNNPLDSLTVQDGAFTFKKLNRNSYNQCHL